jgi:hypothetical protein
MKIFRFPKVSVDLIPFRAGERGGAGHFYRGSRLNGGPEKLDYGARNRQSEGTVQFLPGLIHYLYGPDSINSILEVELCNKNDEFSRRVKLLFF